MEEDKAASAYRPRTGDGVAWYVRMRAPDRGGNLRAGLLPAVFLRALILVSRPDCNGA
ncbi:hypothetical protein [Novispirillum itersonii]|uniref:hypothetical protein n=1 Tax=Novispirillum itersonii TaxID=189 RepID=UPI00037EF5E5|nr:hypothetical protein [Novispirillum itersonii]